MKRYLLGFALIGPLTVAVAEATPLQSRLEIQQLSGVALGSGDLRSGGTGNSVIDLSTTGGFSGSAPLSEAGIEELLRATAPRDLLRESQPADPGPGLQIYRSLPGPAARRPAARTLPASGELSSEAGAQFISAVNDRQATLRDLVRALVNRSTLPALDQPAVAALAAPAAGRGPTAGPAPRQGPSLLDAILGVAVDQEFVDAVSTVLRPSIDFDGVVALNLFGLREVALLVSPVSNSVRLIDLQSGKSMSFTYNHAAGFTPSRAPLVPGGPAVPRTAGDSDNRIPELLAAIRRWISDYVFNGFTLTVLGIFAMFWSLRRLADRLN